MSPEVPRRGKPEVPKLIIKRAKPNKETPTKRRGGPPLSSKKDDPFFMEAVPQRQNPLWADLVASPQSDDLRIALPDDSQDEEQMND
jgi:hypothetical protein